MALLLYLLSADCFLLTIYLNKGHYSYNSVQNIDKQAYRSAYKPVTALLLKTSYDNKPEVACRTDCCLQRA